MPGNYMENSIDSKLFKIVRHGYGTVPFYRELLQGTGMDLSSVTWEDFEKLPLVDKKMIINSNAEMLSDKYQGYADQKKLTIRRTSGSSGHYLKIYWDVFDNTRSLLGLWYRRKQFYHINPQDKFCYFYTTDYLMNKYVEPKEATVSFDNRSMGFSKRNMNSERIIDIYMRMLDFQPVWLMMQPSIALLFSNVIRKNKLPKIESLTYMELTGEYLTGTVREEIEAAFQCTVSNQYGCNEANSIASECPNKKLHLNSSNVYVEILKEGRAVPMGEEGDIYITTLENQAMPFIRYRIGEKGILHDSASCSCGCKDMVLELKNGRDGVPVTTENQEQIPSYIFIRPIEYINEKVGNIIKQFQIVQHDINQFTVKLVIKASYMNWKDTIKEVFLEELQEEALRNAQWEFVYTDELLPDDRTGKLAYFINECKSTETL